MRNTDDDEVGWTEAQWIVSNGKAKAAPAPRYLPSITTCALCPMPCTGVMCLSCATR